tara:strand:- start:1802 stop:1999 length:198 start_codon:yes stop_codon:yes gene_type:complete
MPTHKETGRNRNNEYVHQTIESYLEWWEKAHPAKKKAHKNRYRKTTESKDYIFKRDYKEIIISFD